MAEAPAHGLIGFLYVPCRDVIATGDLSKHRALRFAFAPLNWIDRQFFGGDYPVDHIDYFTFDG
jgi:hypothetical protein